MWPPAMWSTVLVMAAVAAIDPLRIGVVAFMLSRSRPVRLLLPFFLFAFTRQCRSGCRGGVRLQERHGRRRKHDAARGWSSASAPWRW